MRIRACLFSFRVLLCVTSLFICWELTGSTSIATAEGHPVALRKSLLAHGRGHPWISLSDGYEIFPEGQTSLQEQFAKSGMLPLSLAAGDLDQDGVTDLLSGYATPGGGLILFNRGNADRLEGISSVQQAGGLSSSPFLPFSQVLEVSIEPDFMAVGDFGGDRSLDLVLASRKHTALFSYIGNGKGRLAFDREIPVHGRITALVAEDINRKDGRRDLVVGVDSPDGCTLRVYSSLQGALGAEPVELQVDGPVRDIVTGRFDSDLMVDLAVALENQILVISGWDGMPELPNSGLIPEDYVARHFFENPVTQVAAGDFVDSKGRNVAALMQNGRIIILETEENGLREVHSIETRTSTLMEGPEPSVRVPRPQLLVGRNSTIPKDHLILTDPRGGRLRMVLPGRSWVSEAVAVATRLTGEARIVDFAFRGAPVDVLAAFLNRDAFSDLVILGSDPAGITVSESTCVNPFWVNQEGDESDADLDDNRCDIDLDTPEDQCTFKAAVSQANSSPGHDCIYFSGVTHVPGLWRYPDIEESVTIDGSLSDSQMVVIDAAFTNLNYSGLTVDAENCWIGRVQVSGFRQGGIALLGDHNWIQDAVIGPNNPGIDVYSEGNTIVDNTIEGNRGFGILFSGSDVVDKKNIVRLNQIRDNNSAGIHAGSLDSVEISENEITGNYDGIYLGSPGSLVTENSIGGQGLGNERAGIIVNGKDSSIFKNVIANNGTEEEGGSGIELWEYAENTDISENRIFANVAADPSNEFGRRGLGIVGRWDQALPELTLKEGGGVSVSLQSTPLSRFKIEFFSNSACDPSGYGEGEDFLGRLEVETDSEGNINCAGNSCDFPSGGIDTTATARHVGFIEGVTGEGLPNNPGNTSGFSACAEPWVAPPIVVNSIADYVDPETKKGLKAGAGECDTGRAEITRPDGKKEKECTLRAAIELANLLEGTQEVHFNIPGEGIHTIAVGSSDHSWLPAVEEALVIDGTTQPGFVTKIDEGKPCPALIPLIRLDGTAVESPSDEEWEGFLGGLEVTAGGSTLRGLEVTNFWHGIVLHEGGGNIVDLNRVVGNSRGFNVLSDRNKVGVSEDPDALLAECTVRNIVSDNGIGIFIAGVGNQVAGNLVGTRGGNQTGFEIVGERNQVFGNVVSGNKQDGIEISVDAEGNELYANLIGTGELGEKPLPNGRYGIYLNGSRNTIGGRARNIISGNASDGVVIFWDEAEGNVITGNYIGVTADGTALLKNGGTGIYDRGIGTEIGGTEPEAWNIIAGNGKSGIALNGQKATVVGNWIGLGREEEIIKNESAGILIFDTFKRGSGNLISGNKIVGNSVGIWIKGVHASKNILKGNEISENEGDGVLIEDAPGNEIGGPDKVDANEIVLNDGYGVRIFGLEAVGNIVDGNLIGVTNQGAPAGQILAGVSIGAFSNGVFRNTIAYNGGGGLVVSEGAFNPLIQNEIFSNVTPVLGPGGQLVGYKGLGIDLGEDEVTLNDRGDLDYGANDQQNYPELIQASHSEKGTSVSGWMYGTPGHKFRIELFLNAQCSHSGFGEGEAHIADFEEQANTDGFVEFALVLPDAPVGTYLTATATDLDTDNSSEFSYCSEIKMDSDGDGMPDELESEDSNGDGIPDSQQSQIVPVRQAILVGQEGTSIEETASLLPPTGSPVGTSFPFDLVRFGLQGTGGESGPLSSDFAQALEPGGGAVTITMIVPEGLKPDSFFNYGPTPDNRDPHWYEFVFDGRTGAEIKMDRILLHLIDGDRGDGDLLANGVVAFWGGPATFDDLYFPFYQADSKSFVGFAVSNFSDQPARLKFDGLDPEGALLPYGENPKEVTLQGQTQLARLGNEIFGAEAGTIQLGWVVLDTDNRELGSFFQFGGANRLDGSVAFSRQSRHFFFTRVYEGDTAFRGQPATTVLTVANPNEGPVTLELTLWAAPEGAGAFAPSMVGIPVSVDIPGRGFLTDSVADLLEVEEVSGGYLEAEVTQGPGAVGFELIRLPQHQTVIGLNASTDEQVARLYSAQLASASNIYTSLKLVNASDQERSVIVSAVGDDGSLLAEDAVIDLASGESGEWDVSELFSGETPHESIAPAQNGSTTAMVGSLRLAVEGPGVLGDVIFGDPVGFTYAAALSLQTRTFREAVFSQVANLTTFFTGLALYNPGGKAAEVTIEIYSTEGIRTGVHSFTLDPGKRISDILANLLPETVGQVGGYVNVRSSEGLIAQQLFGDFGLNLMSAVPPTIIE